MIVSLRSFEDSFRLATRASVSESASHLVCGLVISGVLCRRKLIFAWSFQLLRVEASLGDSMNAKEGLSAANR